MAGNIYYRLPHSGKEIEQRLSDVPIALDTAETAKNMAQALRADAEAGKFSGDSNVQPDWTQTDDTQDDYIKNKPEIPKIGNDLLVSQGEISVNRKSLLGDSITGTVEDYLNEAKDSIKLKDQSTSVIYELCVVDGKLTLKGGDE